MKHRYLWAVVAGILLAAAFAYALLDAFTLKKQLEGLNLTARPPARTSLPPQVTRSPAPTATAPAAATASATLPPPDPTEPPPIWQSAYAPPDTDEELALYDDGQLYIRITGGRYYESNFFVAHVMVKDALSLRTAFAGGVYGRNYTDQTSDIAEQNGAIFAVSGDYYGFRDEGFVLRNGVLYRDLTDEDALVIMDDGWLHAVNANTHNAESLLDAGAAQGLEFGPVLVDGGLATGDGNPVSDHYNPRCAIGQIGDKEYLFVVVEGRSDESRGVTCDELAEFFLERGCGFAYNLDGGGSAVMWYDGGVLNDPTYGGERRVSDIIYFAPNKEVAP